MFEERFTLCFKMVGKFSNVEIYVLIFFAYVDFGLQPCGGEVDIFGPTFIFNIATVSDY